MSKLASTICVDIHTFILSLTFLGFPSFKISTSFCFLSSTVNFECNKFTSYFEQSKSLFNWLYSSCADFIVFRTIRHVLISLRLFNISSTYSQSNSFSTIFMLCLLFSSRKLSYLYSKSLNLYSLVILDFFVKRSFTNGANVAVNIAIFPPKSFINLIAYIVYAKISGLYAWISSIIILE